MTDDRILNGTAGALADHERGERRRFARFGEPVSVPTLVDQSMRSAEMQLLDAREALKEARRRVVQLEDALERWREMRDALTRRDSESRRASSN